MKNLILFNEINGTGIVHLYRPKALNALNLEMAEEFLKQLAKWKIDKNIKRVLLTGEGKAFCAGGDIKSMFLSTKVSNLKKNFLFKEYTLNYFISQFSKPYLSIWNGIVMGGGVGLSVYGSARIASEKSRFAMPETGIGFFPDVGGSYFLSRISEGIGLYLGLTGKVINAKELVTFGLATHFQYSENIEKTKSRFINNGFLPSSQNIIDGPSKVLSNLNFIQDTFCGDCISIMNTLKNAPSEFAKQTYNCLLKRCPMSLAITVELLNRAKKLSLKECLEMEYQLSQHIVYRDDFNNGVDAILVSKTYNPGWNPASIHDINFEEVNKFFKPHIEPLNLQ